MVCAHVRSIIPSLKLGDNLSVQAQRPSSISHLLDLKRNKISLDHLDKLNKIIHVLGVFPFYAEKSIIFYTLSLKSLEVGLEFILD